MRRRKSVTVTHLEDPPADARIMNDVLETATAYSEMKQIIWIEIHSDELKDLPRDPAKAHGCEFAPARQRGKGQDG
ncbi:hypothetical protein Trco_000831 [Trichoderma cornu-damae]|uniref:Uncharacterized protein n=1 Tax=Trichoderma cornu-damae TaxID=654480 RepID=A0A9P8QR24_9HYPO|nr:hypothetical protein Trco_000831 [Trichoderma cornu-damae]